MDIFPPFSHLGIINLLGTIQSPHGLASIFPYTANGDLLKQIQDGPLPEHIARRGLYQLLQTVGSLNRQDVLHRALKPDNILLLNNDDSLVVITDFEMSVRPGSATVQNGVWAQLNSVHPRAHNEVIHLVVAKVRFE
jgi:serine/threonine protein kinase